MVKDMLDDVADIVGASFSVTKARSEVLDFMMPFEAEDLRFFIPMQTSYSWNTYLLPFLYESWSGLSAMLVVLAVGFAFVAKVGKDDCLEEFTLRKCTTFVLGAYGGVGVRRWDETPRNISARLVSSVLSSFLYIIIKTNKYGVYLSNFIDF